MDPGFYQVLGVAGAAVEVRLDSRSEAFVQTSSRRGEDAAEHGVGAVVILCADLDTPTRRKGCGDRG